MVVDEDEGEERGGILLHQCTAELIVFFPRGEKKISTSSHDVNEQQHQRA